MIAGGKIVGGGCRYEWNREILASADINGDGVMETIASGYCTEDPKPAADDFWVFSDNHFASDWTRLGGSPKTGYRRFFQYTGTAYSTDMSFCPLNTHCRKTPYTVGDIIKLPDGNFANINFFAFDVNATGNVDASLAVYYAPNSEGEQMTPLSSLQKIASLKKELGKSGKIMTHIRRRYSKELAEIRSALSYADLQNLREPHFTKVSRLTVEIEKALWIELKREIRGNFSQERAYQQIHKELGLPEGAGTRAAIAQHQGPE